MRVGPARPKKEARGELDAAEETFCLEANRDDWNRPDLPLRDAGGVEMDEDTANNVKRESVYSRGVMTSPRLGIPIGVAAY